ncbi:MAG: hypothetical protein A2158_00740 [Chloroflexi bacterium RBG_13_46_14]|nr:MAG: hypothetical protein A2158_00740 [Chloroflexi bacterium RBG_13_46_14]
MKKLITTGILLILSAALLLPVAGCGEETNGLEQPEETEPVASESNRWVELLNVIPENDTTVNAVYMQDIAYLHERQTEFPDAEPYAVMRLSMTGSSGLFRHYFDMTDPEADVPGEYRETIGFTLEEVGQMITSGIQPYIYEAYRGNFDEKVIDNAVKTGPRSDELEIIEYGDMEYYRWGEDNAANLNERTHVRPLGKGHRLALPGDFAFWVTWDEGIETMIDCYNDTVGSLADIDEYKLMAEGLSILDAFSGYMTTDTNSYDEVKDYLERERNCPNGKDMMNALNCIWRTYPCLNHTQPWRQERGLTQMATTLQSYW